MPARSDRHSSPDRAVSAPESAPARRSAVASPGALWQAFATAAPPTGGRAQAPSVQPLLRVGRRDDVFEREADRIADEVVSDAVRPASATGSAAAPPLQRLSAEVSPAYEDAVVEEEQPQGAPDVSRLSLAGGAGPVPGAANLAGRLATSTSGGRPLDPEVGGHLGARLHHDLSAVRVHDDPEAHALAGDLQARAFTHRRHIYFAPGEYAPRSPSGLRVLAHELAHTIQQDAVPAAEQSGGAAHGPQPPPIQRMSSLDTTRVDRTHVKPWGAPAPEGTDYNVLTDAGSPVSGWVAYSPYRIELHYWCHGLSLGTFARWGYSVYSGAPMRQVVTDEYTDVLPTAAMPGDIIVFLPNFDHSARLTSVVLNGSALDEDKSRVDTKNGQAPAKNDSVMGVRGVYSGAYRIFHHR
jgi:Domain of unknown function (DUF4157)